ncbi:MAG: zinc ribbon domain-containing protein [Oscillospiraceae bacterium]|nr:zinc ribbon domain-containing protein [Oscillospiraceae bacterium]
MFCTNCGKQIPEGSRFCTNCGAKLNIPEAPEKAAPEQPAFTPPAAPVYTAPEAPAAPAAPEQPVYTAPAAPEQPVFTPPAAPVYAAPEAPAAPAAPEQPVYTAPTAPEQPVYRAPEAPAAPAYTVPEAPAYSAPQQQPYAAQQTYAAPAYAPQQTYAAPPKQKKGPKLGLIIGIIAAVVVIGALVACFLLGVFSGPKGTVGRALKKSVKAYSTAVDALDPIDLKALYKEKKLSENVEFTLKEIDGDDSMSGYGARVFVNYSGSDRAADVVFTPFTSDTDIATVQLALKDTKLYIGSPELTDGEFYGLDTKTLGRDFSELSGSDELEDLGFNFFELVDKIEKMSEDLVDKKGVEAANKELNKAITVVKDGKEIIDVNGKTVKAAKYNVKIPQKALETYIESVVKCIKAEKFGDNLADLFISVGFDEYDVEDLRDSFDDIDFDEWVDEIEENVLDELGDIELKVYVSGGYISAFVYEKKVDDQKIVLSGYFGGPNDYVDNVTLSALSKGDDWSEEYVLTSSGNHALKGGVFWDETKIVEKYNGSKYTIFSSQTEYNNGSGALSLRIKTDDGDNDIKLEGTLKMNAKSLDLTVSDLKIKDYYGDTVLAASGAVRIGTYDKSSAIAVSGARMLSDMSEDDFTELGEKIGENLNEISEETGLDLSIFGMSGSDEQRDNGIIYGYDEGYEIGYQDGWDEVDYGDNYDDDPASYGYSGGSAFRSGFEEGFDWGYYDGYWDGYPGYNRYTSYGENRPALSTYGATASDSYYDGLTAGYDTGYEDGYDDGWDEVDYGENYNDSAYGDSDYLEGYYEGYEFGYDDGYWDGYPGYTRYANYGSSAWWWS